MKKIYQNFESIIIILIMIFLSLLPALQKITGQFPPEWFINKFTPTILGQIPFGIELSFGIIVVLEVIVAILFMYSILLLLTQKPNYNTILSLSFDLALILMLILFFGSFLVKDYDNGFNDFIYFVGILFLKNYTFSKIRD